MLAAATALTVLALLQTPVVEPAGDPTLTILADDFSIVREVLPLNLAPGVQEVIFTKPTLHLKPDSVVLRDVAGRRNVRIRSQVYRSERLSERELLSRYEGQTVDFLRGDETVPTPCRVIRAGWVRDRYDHDYCEPIVECNGKTSFGLPGVPLFPSWDGAEPLEPQIRWQLEVDQPGQFDAELRYATRGLSWRPHYSLIADEERNTLEFFGWIAIENESGRTFEHARVLLLDGASARDHTRVLTGPGNFGNMNAFNGPEEVPTTDDY